jgi:hypothetical protein
MKKIAKNDQTETIVCTYNQNTYTLHIFLEQETKPLISVLHIEVVARPYVMSKISYFIVRAFDVKHHAAHGTILINFGSLLFRIIPLIR